MTQILYNIGCRNCLQSDGLFHTYNWVDGKQEEIKDKTEFEIMNLIEIWLLGVGQLCHNCGSSNVEVLDIEIDDYRLYDFEALDKKIIHKKESMLQFNIDKRAAKIKLTRGGSPELDTSFLKAAIIQIIDLLNQRTSYTYLSQIKGNFFICLTGSNDKNIRIERLRYHGLTRSEIINALNPVAEKLGIIIPGATENRFHGLSIFDGISFRGALFNYSIYAESLEKAKEGGYSYANACFDFDERNIIAYGMSYGESPAQFIENNRNQNFMVDTSIRPFNLQEKRMFYAKKVD